MTALVAVLLLAGLPGQGGFAHRGFAPHFDLGDRLSISGTITEFEARNPHVYLHIDGTEGDPQTQTLNVLIERKDPKFYTRNFLPISLDYAPSNVEIARFDCTPEV